MSTPRPENSPILGVSMNPDLKARIKLLADAEERTMSKWAAIKLKEVVEQIEAEHASKLEKTTPAPLMMVADQPGESSFLSTPAAGVQPVKYQGGRRNR